MRSESNLAVYAEFWISLASLLRSYTALHGLSSKQQATVVADENHISVRRGEHYLNLERFGQIVTWDRKDGTSGAMDFTEEGQLRSRAGLEEMDMAAERWARELMQ